MDSNSGNYNFPMRSDCQEEYSELKRGPWSDEEDMKLVNYIANHGEGRWNSLATSAGLKRTGKSCRLRWLNYLRPNVRRGNLTLEEQLMILELHCRWGNRWSKIAQQLPGRTDNEIKNYWRTRVQKHAKQLQCDVNSKQFKDTLRYIWIPRLMERIHAAAAAPAPAPAPAPVTNHVLHMINTGTIADVLHINNACNMEMSINSAQINSSYTPENSSTGGSSDSHAVQVDEFDNNIFATQNAPIGFENSLISPKGYYENYGMEFQGVGENCTWVGSEDLWGNLWNVDDMGF